MDSSLTTTSHILGVPSSRPELRCPTAAAVQAFEDIEWKNNLKNHLHLCATVIGAEDRCCLALADAGFSSPETPFMLHLEKALMDISAPALVNGTFYCSLFKIGSQFYLRYFESGVLSGYFLSEGRTLVQTHLHEVGADELAISKLIWTQVSTDEDIVYNHQRKTKQLERKRSYRAMSSGSTSEVGKRYTNLLQKNKSSVFHSHRNLDLMEKAQPEDRDCHLIGIITSVIKSQSHNQKNQQKARFFEASLSFHPHAHIWENSIQKFRTDGIVPQPFQFTSLLTAPTSSSYTWDEQCKIVSTIPNNHYWNEGNHSHVLVSRMLSHRDKSGKYKPASLRNLVLLHTREGNYSLVFEAVSRYLNLDSASSSSTTDNDIHPSTSQVAPEPNPRHFVKRRALTEEDIIRNIQQLNPNFNTQNRATDHSSFVLYKTAQIESGKIFWRVHQSNIDIVALNDVNMTTGCFTPHSFVHLSRLTSGGVTDYHCTCNLYATLLQLATLNEADTDVSSVNIRCCHIRFFLEIVEPDLDNFFGQNSIGQSERTKIQSSITNSLDFIGKAVCCVSSNAKTTRFSVISPDSLECKFVNLSKNRLSCQSGECRALYGCSQRKVLHLDSAQNVCPHLFSMKNHQEMWSDVLNQSMELGFHEDGDENDDIIQDTELEEADDEGIQVENTSDNHFFNQSTGLWNFPSLSVHQPKSETDETLQKSISQRLAIFDGAQGVTRDSNGRLVREIPLLLTLCPPIDAENRDCHCGAGYYNDECPDGILSDIRYKPVVYLTNGPAKYEVRDRECMALTPECCLEYCGSMDSIHFLSKETGAGDEIGWEYVDHALNTQITFTSFCKLMSKKYKRNYTNSGSFLSPQTFIAWWFSWSSKFKIDFRKPCHICKHKPRFLACDGTKIGINFRYADVQPIETPSIDDIIDPCHRRNSRCFLDFDQDNSQNSKNIVECRKHLLYVSKKALDLLSEKEQIPYEVEIENSRKLIEMVDPLCSDLMRKFICNEYPHTLKKSLAVCFKILSTNHSITGFVPFRFVDLFESVLNDLTPGTIESGNNNRINLVAEFSPEIRNILVNSLVSNSVLMDVVHFFEYLIRRVRDIKNLNKNPTPPVPQPGSYNPEKFGVAYYFTPHGQKLRDIPNYSMNLKAHSRNYDDLPLQDGEKCSKIYPEVSRKGTTYLFLWFDPKHYGHCYGFHMIPGSEGRKDPFSSAYCYLEEAPEEIFYDFACQLEEYALNREPGFFEHTRFFHDLFHGFSHKCPCSFKSQRIASLQGLNTEICEQFNSFIQKIKYSARSMSLGKFCYYLQFMIFQWCEIKRAAFEKRCDIAATYLE